MNQRMMIVLLLALVAGITLRATAGIPEPDVILYGSVCIDGIRQQGSHTDVTVTATVDIGGIQHVVGQYRMGDSERAGDLYVLRIRRQSGVDGSEQSTDAARAGGQVHVALQKGNASPMEAAQFTIDEPGTARRLNLFVGDVGLDGDGDADLLDFSKLQRCFTGSSSGLSEGCASADVDNNGTVDLIDFQIFASRITGPCS
jgi:hypothetical protein